MARQPPPWPLVIGALLVMVAVVWLRARGWLLADPPAPVEVPASQEAIPPSIRVTEQSLPSVSPGASAPGTRDLAGYAAPGGNDLDDMRMLARSASAFLAIHHQAGERPLSANEEWSAALRGQRPGTTRWLEDGPPVFSPEGKIIDRHGTPVHFHALGRKAWEFRSAGPDRILFTADDAVDGIGKAER